MAAPRKCTEELAEARGGEEVKPHEALLFLARRMLETDPMGTPRGRVEKEESIYTLLYHVCPGCRRASLPSGDGAVEIPEDVVRRVEGEARKVAIRPEEEVDEDAADSGDANRHRESGEPDHPNSAVLTRKVILRDGARCSNPCCRRRLGLHAHHLRFRSVGGRTALFNDVAVCQTCHALIHAGLLEVKGNPTDGLEWLAAGDRLARDLEEERDELGQIPVVHVDGGTREQGRPRPASGSPESGLGIAGGRASQEQEEERLAGLLEALSRLGFSKTAAKKRLAAAREAFQKLGRAPTDEDLLLAVFRPPAR